MDNSILNNTIAFISTSIGGGITWDIIKSGILKISFVNKFKRFFNNDDILTEKYIKEISTTQSLSAKRPFNDIKTMYEELTNTDMPKGFEECISEWIKENKDSLNKSLNSSNNVFNIKNQVANNSSTINNINTQNNYK